MTPLNCKALYACNMASAKKDMFRPMLQGVYTHVKDGKRIYVGTDGRSMIKIQESVWPEDKGESLIIPQAFITPHLKDADSCVLEGNSLHGPFGVLNFNPVQSQYPDYARVLDFKPDIASSIGFNVKYAAMILKAFNHYQSKDGKRQQEHLMFDLQGPDKPLQFESGNFLAVLMPVVKK